MKVNLGQYKGLGIPGPQVAITDEEVIAKIDEIRSRFLNYLEKEEKISEGDYVTLDYDCFFEEELIEVLSLKNHHSRIGAGHYVKEFEEKLLGQRVGDCFEIELQIESDHHLRHLRNEMVTFKVHIKEVRNRVLPELTDETVKNIKIEEVETLEALKKHVAKEVYYKKYRNENIEFVNKMMADILNASHVELDETIVEEQAKEIYEDFEKQLSLNNATLDIYLGYTKQSLDSLIERCRIEAETYLTEKIVVEEIISRENIVLSEEEKTNCEDELDEQDKLYQKTIHYLLEQNLNRDCSHEYC